MCVCVRVCGCVLVYEDARARTRASLLFLGSEKTSVSTTKSPNTGHLLTATKLLEMEGMYIDKTAIELLKVEKIYK